MYSKLLTKLIKVKFESELFPPHVKSIVNGLYANFNNDQVFDNQVNILISTNPDEDNDFVYQIIIGNRHFEVQKNKRGLIFYINYSEVGDLLPNIFDLIMDKLKEDLFDKFEIISDATLKNFKVAHGLTQNEDLSLYYRKIEKLILTNGPLNLLKEQINELEESKIFGCKIIDIEEIPFLEKGNLFPIFLNRDQSLGWGFSWSGKNKLNKVFLDIVALLRDHLEITSYLSNRAFRFEVWESAVEALPMGLVVIDSKDNIRIYNQKFIDLNLPLKSLEQLGHKEFLKLGEESFQVLISSAEDASETYKVYLFQRITEQLEIGGSNGNEELGIICSSLAHELNNPIAGILASLTIIEMEDEKGNLKVQLEDMKNGVHRCKQLVETFLGFSKSQKFENTKRISEGFKSSFDQALDLMRFRMIESNISLQINFHEQKKYISELDFSLMVMMNYLLLGEVLTALSHHNLLMQQNSKVIHLDVVEEKEQIRITWKPDFALSNDFTKSTLFLHLLETQELVVSFEDGSVTFSPFINDVAESGQILV